MALFSHIIFDMDGTLLDSKPGIYHSLQYVIQKMGIPVSADSIIDAIIGPPIDIGLKTNLHLREDQVEHAVAVFREYYTQHGALDAELYPGISDCLAELFKKGKQIYLATSKNERYIEPILSHYNLLDYFRDTIGSHGEKTPTKGDLIKKLMLKNELNPSDKIVMVGDTHFDILGAKDNQIGTIAVGYGFGDNDHLKSLNPDYFVSDVPDLQKCLLS